MAETIREHHSGPKWHWYSVMRDLQDQGGLYDIRIDPLSTRPDGHAGAYGDIFFHITWIKDAFMLLSMKRYSQDLVDAFAKVLEYQPLCSYVDENGLATVEWDKLDPNKRFAELSREGQRELKRLTPVS